MEQGRTEHALERALSALANYCFGGKSLQDTLGTVATMALEAVEPADFVAVIVSLERRPVTTFFTDRRAFDLDQVQYAADSGPCLDAFRDGTTYVIPEMSAETRWPEFAAAACQQGVNSTLSLPLTAAGLRLGALNLYSHHESSFGDDEAAVAASFAAPASVMLANAAAYSDAVTLSEDLGQAMASRETIEQAKGIIMATMRCTPDEAFAVLVQQSQTQNVKVRHVAEEIVRNATRR